MHTHCNCCRVVNEYIAVAADVIEELGGSVDWLAEESA